MMSDRNVIVDFAQGLALIGVSGSQTQVAIAATAGGELRVSGPDGPLLRPLSFGVRSQLVLESTVAPRPVEAVCAALRQAMMVSAGDASAGDSPPKVLDVLALHLAGADEPGAPSFAEAARLVVQATGWSPVDLAQADALLIDHLATQLSAAQPANGWRRFVLGGPASADLSALRAELAENLLQRAEIRPLELPETPGAARIGGSTAASSAQNGHFHFVPPQQPATPPFPAGSQNANETPASGWAYADPVSDRGSGAATAAAEKRSQAQELGTAHSRRGDPTTRRLAARWRFGEPVRPTSPDNSSAPAGVVATPGAARPARNDSATARAAHVAAGNGANHAPAAATAPQLIDWPDLGTAEETSTNYGAFADSPDEVAVTAPRDALLLQATRIAAAANAPATATPLPVKELAEELAALLHEEADLRGLQR